MPMATTEEQREYQRQWMAKRRQEWVKENGPCQECGSIANLEVDHINPDEKKFHPSAIWSLALDNPKRIAELEKCQVLCEACHVKKTSTQRGWNISHGSASGYNERKCRCSQCKAWKSAALKRETRRQKG